MSWLRGVSTTQACQRIRLAEDIFWVQPSMLLAYNPPKTVLEDSFAQHIAGPHWANKVDTRREGKTEELRPDDCGGIRSSPEVLAKPRLILNIFDLGTRTGNYILATGPMAAMEASIILLRTFPSIIRAGRPP
jgi:hypothetical protein